MKINEMCLKHNVKRYISIDALISEGDKPVLYDYLEFLKKINPDGIYFADLSVINVAKNVGLETKLIYDSGTMICNSLDANFFIKQGIGVVLSRELSIDEVVDIIKNNLREVDMQVFGHLRMSYSKRKFLGNYFKHIGKDVDYLGADDIRLQEEGRDYVLPIIEDEYGTRIYTDYILMMYKELAHIKYVLKRMIVDDNFIEDENLVLSVIRDIKRLTVDNSNFLIEGINSKYPNMNFSSGYLYKKTTKVKEANE
ncbi:MAG: U32 family peptidase [Erysipelotrichaceae bacterium]|nr:U32 family peptidase [Erysipelotrichaceae bacterium]